MNILAAPTEENKNPTQTSGEKLLVKQLVAEANAAFESGNTEKARKNMRAAFKITPDDGDLALALGPLELDAEDIQAACEAYAAAVKLKPRFAEAHAGHALALQLLNHPADAAMAAHRALTFNPENEIAQKVLVRIHLNALQPEIAITICRRLLAKNEADAEASMMLEEAQTLKAAQASPTGNAVKPNPPSPSINVPKELPGQSFQGDREKLGKFFTNVWEFFADVAPPPLTDLQLRNSRVVQSREHILTLMPKGAICAEVGTQTGTFAKLILNEMKPAKLHVFDMDYTHFDFPHFDRDIHAGKVVVHKGDSSTLLSQLPDKYFDFIYVDGSHSYEGVTKDLDQAALKIKDDGWIVCNDFTIYSPPEAAKYGVYRAVNEFCLQRDYEIIYLGLHPLCYHDVALRRRNITRQAPVIAKSEVPSENVSSVNPYTLMQKSQYEREADLMNRENHRGHNANPDYWNILVKDTESGFQNKVGLDFGCGCGRNVMNLWQRFARMDGVDISAGNLKHARENLIAAGCPEVRFRLHEVSGVDLGLLPSSEYDFIMSTIVLQHIAVHDIRYGYLKEFYRVMKPGGLLSFQMGFGEGYGKAGYYENHYDAKGTNSCHDTKVTSPEQLTSELRELGFVNIRHEIRPSFDDGHPSWIFVKADKPSGVEGDTLKAKAFKATTATTSASSSVIPKADFARTEHLPTVALFSAPKKIQELGELKVSYQDAQFAHLARHTNVFWSDHPAFADAKSISSIASGLDTKLDAAIVFDEYNFLSDSRIKEMNWNEETLMVYIAHDFWCHPLSVAEKLSRIPRVLMVLRHESALKLFDRLLPGVPKVVQRPGVETSVFHPHDEVKKYDVLLGGSETPDYPIRRRINRLVRDNANRYGWKVLDLASPGLMSNPQGSQRDYAALLAASKVSPTGSNRGGSHGCKLVTQYFDLSTARAQYDHEFYGLKNPELRVEQIDTGGITPRYLESLACKSLLIADLPLNDRQHWYQDKMVVIRSEMADDEILGVIDHWVRNDAEREAFCDRAWQAVQNGETSEHKAVELIQIIQSRL